MHVRRVAAVRAKMLGAEPGPRADLDDGRAGREPRETGEVIEERLGIVRAGTVVELGRGLEHPATPLGPCG